LSRASAPVPGPLRSMVGPADFTARLIRANELVGCETAAVRRGNAPGPFRGRVRLVSVIDFEEADGRLQNHCLADNSSAVDAISSDAAAFCWITWSSCMMALFTCSAPVLCSALAAAISRTSSAVFLISGTNLTSRLPALSAVFTPSAVRR